MQSSYDDPYALGGTAGGDDRQKPRRWSGLGFSRPGVVALLLLSLFACLAGDLLVPGGIGFVIGYQELQSLNHENAIQHFQRGLGFLAENYPELAYTEFEIAVKYDSSYGPAQQKLREMETAFGGHGTPQAAEEDQVAAALLDDGRRLVGQKQWSDAVTRLEQLRTLNAEFHQQEATDLLYTAYVEGGKEAVSVGQIELARERFDSALAIRNGDPEVVRQRDRAVLYLDGQQAAGYNWPLAIQKFSALYQQDPKYDDIKKRLIDAYAQYGDAAAKQGAWCLAAKEYDSALGIASDPQLSGKRSQAMSQCRQAVAATPTLLPAPGGTTVGTENYVLYRVSTSFNKPCNTRTGDLSGVVQDVLGQPVVGVNVAYYADGIDRVIKRTDANGAYEFILGNEPGLFHVLVLGADGRTQVSMVADIPYPGGSNVRCHVVVDWQKVQ